MSTKQIKVQTFEDEIIGYNEWARETLQVNLYTDFVYDQIREVAKEYEFDWQDLDDRGVYIAEDISPQTIILSIPFTSLFTLHAIHENKNSTMHAPLYELQWFQTMDPDIEDEQLAIALLYEKYLLKEHSKWSRHIRILPTIMHNLLYFTKEDLQHLIGSPLYLMGIEMQGKVQRDYEKLAKNVLPELYTKVKDSKVLQCPSNEILETIFTLENYTWAISIVWSRFVSVDKTMKNGQTSMKAMIPVFDMLNHEADAEMAHYYNSTNDRFELKSFQHWRAGSEIGINYGPNSSHKLLALYGFVQPDNNHDTVEFLWHWDEQATIDYKAKREIIHQKVGEYAFSTPFELVESQLNEQLLKFVRIQVLDITKEKTGEQLNNVIKKALKGQLISHENEKAALAVLISRLEAALANYKQSMEEDKAQLAAWDAESITDRYKLTAAQIHERLSVRICYADKRILNAHREMLQWKYLELLKL